MLSELCVLVFGFMHVLLFSANDRFGCNFGWKLSTEAEAYLSYVEHRSGGFRRKCAKRVGRLFCFYKVTEPAVNFLFFLPVPRNEGRVKVFVFVSYSLALNEKMRYESQFSLANSSFLMRTNILETTKCEVEFWEVFCLKKVRGFLKKWLSPYFPLVDCRFADLESFYFYPT